jgi:predicted DCC family thiol-disulfide oxidoreductase YuxK
MPDAAPVLPTTGITIVYDGDCPLCQTFVTRLRLRKAAGAVHLIDARQADAVVGWLTAQGYAIDDGFVVQVDDRLYYGAGAAQVLALLSSRSDWFNALNYRIFRSPARARWLYPPLVAGRRALLWLLGRKPLLS